MHQRRKRQAFTIEFFHAALWHKIAYAPPDPLGARPVKRLQ
jgi:hypothetical protein